MGQGVKASSPRHSTSLSLSPFPSPTNAASSLFPFALRLPLANGSLFPFFRPCEGGPGPRVSTSSRWCSLFLLLAIGDNMSSKGVMGAFEKTQRESKKQRQRLHSDKEKGQKKRGKNPRADYSNGITIKRSLRRMMKLGAILYTSYRLDYQCHHLNLLSGPPVPPAAGAGNNSDDDESVFNDEVQSNVSEDSSASFFKNEGLSLDTKDLHVCSKAMQLIPIRPFQRGKVTMGTLSRRNCPTSSSWHPERPPKTEPRLSTTSAKRSARSTFRGTWKTGGQFLIFTSHCLSCM